MSPSPRMRFLVYLVLFLAAAVVAAAVLRLAWAALTVLAE
jgi:hypothetical protein